MTWRDPDADVERAAPETIAQQRARLRDALTPHGPTPAPTDPKEQP